jgi:hypothetical protein
MRSLKYYFTAFLLFIVLTGHIGSPGVIFEGELGPYRIMANINPPEVIPGIAYISVMVNGGSEDLQLQAKPIYWSAGLNGTPKADPLLPSTVEPGRYEGELWFMNGGTSSVTLQLVEGDEIYEAVIPIMAWPTAQKEMDLSLGIILGGLGLFLVILLVTIISSAMSDSLSDPGVEMSLKLRKRRNMGIILGSSILVLILWGGKSWWDAEAASYKRMLYQPFQATSQIITKEDGQYLHFQFDSLSQEYGRIIRKLSYIVPDHGKLMHLFLIKEGSLDVFAHLHPQRSDTLNFYSKLPPLPPGRYHVFADITRYTGFAETVSSTLEIPEKPIFNFTSQQEITLLDRDDTYTFSNPVGSGKSDFSLDASFLLCGSPGQKTDLPGGYTAIWESDDNGFKAGKLYSLDFALFNPQNEPVELQPYLGMLGHAVVLKHDASVYIHLHPTGNYSMGSQQMLLERFSTGKIGYRDMPEYLSFSDSIDQVVKWMDSLPETTRDSLFMSNMSHAKKEYENPGHETHSMVSFPYAFPEPGDYRIWLQVKIDGNIVNGAFDVIVN